MLHSDKDENIEKSIDAMAEEVPTPETDKLQQRANSFTTAPEMSRPLDSLVASLTRIEPGGGDVETIKVPLLGEIPLDGSILVLVPVTLIAILGFMMSINIALNSSDAIAQQIDQVTNVLSTPPSKKAIVEEGCRGLCSDQIQQLDTMRSFMESLAPKTKVK